MTPEGIVAAVLLVAMTVLWLGLPLLRRPAVLADAEQEKRRLILEQDYQRVLTNISDLDEDFATSKIDEADYRAEREAWVGQAVQILKALDSEPAAEPSGSIPTTGGDIDEAIEAAVAAYRKK
jgi:hypothetical protein